MGGVATIIIICNMITVCKHACPVIMHDYFNCLVDIIMYHLFPSSTATYLKNTLQSNLSAPFESHFSNSLLFASVYSAQMISLNTALALMLQCTVGPHPKFTSVPPAGTAWLYNFNTNTWNPARSVLEQLNLSIKTSICYILLLNSAWMSIFMSNINYCVLTNVSR